MRKLRRVPALGAVALALAAAVAFSRWLGAQPDNDGYALLAFTLGPPPGLERVVTKALEVLLAWTVRGLALDPVLAWQVLGVLHLVGIAAVVACLVRRLLPEQVALPLGAALLAVAAPLVLEHVLQFNSVATLALALLVWVERSLAGSWRGAGLALFVVALSRPDGALLAPLLVLGEALTGPREGAAGRLLARVPLLVLAAGLWLGIDRLANGVWLGIAEAAQVFYRAHPPPDKSAFEWAMWLRSAWLDHASEGLLLLAAIGALARPRRTAPLWVALAAHHVVLLALAVLDRTPYYRFFVADLVLAVPLACLGLHALRSLLVLPWRRLEPVVAAGIAAVALAGYLGNLKELGPLRERLARRQHTPAAAACIEAQLRRHEAPVIVVPSVLFGKLLFRLRDAPVGMLLVPPALPVTPLDPKRAVLALAFEGDGAPPTGEPTLCRRDGVLLRRLRSGA